MATMKTIVCYYVYPVLNHVNIVQHLLFPPVNPASMDIAYSGLFVSRHALKPSIRMARNANHVSLLV